MSTYLDALLSGQSKARSLATNEDAVDVDVSESAPPNPGDVLTAGDSSHATWQPPSGGDGTAVELGSTGAPINVDGAEPPVAGQVLTATDPEHAVWRVPGLHYDPSIKFWTSSVGSATILPNSWGFIQQAEGATEPVVVYIVSSLEAPPVDSRFGLYVWREMTVPVTVNVLGESQIQGLDGVLGTSALLLPGADYEWVFYHEDGAAIWGLVSDTAGIAKHVSLGDAGIVPITQTGDVEVGSVLTFAGDHAEWLPPGGGGGLVFASGTSPGLGEWVVAADNTDVGFPVATEAGQRVGCYVSVGTDGVTVTSGDGIWLNRKLASSHQLRPGGWYEWASVDFGPEDGLRWAPHGGQGDEARPALEDGGTADSDSDLPNQWALVPNAGVANAPQNPINGDCYAVYINGTSASVSVATGQSIVSPDGTTTVAGPGALTLPGNTYYEWIWIASASHWKPKNYLDSPGAGLIRTGKTLAIGTNADASIVVNADDIRVGVLATDAQHGTRGGGTLHALATSSSNGFMSAQQGEKLNQLSNTFKEPARVVAVTNVTLSGLQTIDGVSLVALDRILLTAQTTATQNGLWEVSSSAWGRTSDADGILVANEVKSGMSVYVNEGTTNADTRWALTTNDPISLGSTALTFALFGGLRGSAANIQPISPINAAGTGATPKWAAIDHVHPYQIPDPTANGFRLSTSLTTPVAVDGTYSTIFLAPYKSNKIAVWDTTLFVWQIVTAPVTSQANLSGHTAGTPVDVFVRYTGSSNTLAFDLINWSTPTTRASALTTQDGVTVRSGGTNARYVGTFLPDSATTFSHRAAASDTSSPVCGIWNQDNRILGAFSWTPTFDSWTIPSANTWQSLNGQASAKVQYVQGQSIDIVSAEHIGATDGTGGGALGIGVDSTTTPSGTRSLSANTAVGSVHARLRQVIVAGAHNLNAIANGGTAARFYGAHAPMLGGITAELWY
jgi:hypothetical protein